MFTDYYLIKVVWEFGVETLGFALALIKCCWVAKSKRNSFTKAPFVAKIELHYIKGSFSIFLSRICGK